MVLIRYNPDTVRLNGRVIVANTSAAGNAAGTDKAARINLLVSTIKAELTRPVAGFSVRVIQLYFDVVAGTGTDPACAFTAVQEENITDLVCV